MPRSHFVPVGRRWVATAASLIVVNACEPPPPPVDTSLGVSLELARHRAATLSDVAYAVRLTIPDDRATPLRGTTRVSFERRDSTDGALVLDFKDPGTRVHEVRLDGRPVAWQAIEDHVVLAPDLVTDGALDVEIDYTAGDDALNRSDDFLYTLFVPDRAHFSIPVFDQPDLKARFDLEVRVPDGWVAVSNGRGLEVPADSAGTVRFDTTEPLPTYLFAFAAGRLEVEVAERAGRTLRMYHRETDASRVAANRDDIFDLTAAALDFMETYTGIAYPFGKFDMVLLPPFQYGGMEHPGAVFYRQSSLMLEPTATQAQVLGRASLIAHEIAHMWFGDLVTMRWFDDVWTKEVFANFMAAKIVHPSFPDIDHDLRFLLAHHPSAYAIDRTPGANAIRQPLDNLREAGTLYGPIIYQKAPIVMRQLERTVGEGSFQEGLREYLNQYAYGNATWPDLIDILDRRAEVDLRAWSRVWVEEAGRPTVTIGVDRNVAAPHVATLEQHDPAGLGRVWPQQLTLAPAPGAAEALTTVHLGHEAATVPLDAAVEPPRWVLPNATGLEYGLFSLDSVSLANLVHDLPRLDRALLRGAGWLTVQDAMLEGRLRPTHVLDQMLEALARETDEQLAQMLLSSSGRIYWEFLSDVERAERAGSLEAVLWRGVEGAATRTLRAAYLATYRSVATTPAAVERLRALWSGDLELPGLELGESDLTALAAALAVREVDGSEAIVARQIDRIDNPDRRARFEFIRPALSSDPSVRESFFASLAEADQRSREPWVLDGLAYLNHPLRREHARRFVGPALQMLEEIQRTGDIFFPGRWLDEVLGGHNHPDVMRTVAEFLAGRPDYPPRLRAKVLQSADGVWRAAAIVHGAGGLPAIPLR